MCSIDGDVNSKIIEWKISQIALEKLYPLLYKNVETAGKFNIHFDKKSTTHEVTLIKGQKDSVEAPKSILNYHTHPISCYLGEKTIWGWPSGEDMRESVFFGLKGSVCHIIPAIEGVYITQVNPCILENLIHLKDHINESDFYTNKKYAKLRKELQKDELNPDDFFRGLMALCIEICFRSTHVFRSYEFNKYYNITGQDFVDYSNVFKLDNMFSSKKVKGCGDLNCNNIWTFENKLHKKTTFKQYVKDYEDDTKVYRCNSHGSADYSNILLTKAIELGAIDFMNTLSLGTSCNYPKKLWSENWFLISLVPNEIKLCKEIGFENEKVIDYNSKKLSPDDRWNFLINLHKCSENNSKKFEKVGNGLIQLKNKQKPIFYFFDMKGKCDHNDVKDNLKLRSPKKSHKFGNKSSCTFCKNKELIMFGSKDCRYCKEAYKKLYDKGYKIYKLGDDTPMKDKVYSDNTSIAEAIANAKAYSRKDIKTVPSFFVKDGSNELLDYHIL